MYVPWYIMAAYAYYVEDDPILADSRFDALARRILEHWDEIEHRHKSYLNKDMLEAGKYIGDYTPQIRGALDSIINTYKLEPL